MTDATEVEKLVERLRAWSNDDDDEPPVRMTQEAATMIEAQAAENARLREALELADCALRGAGMNMNVVERKVRAALAATKQGEET